MPVVPAVHSDVLSHPTLAALLLAAVPWLKELGLSSPSSSAVLRSLDVSRGRAYELRARLEARLPELGLALTLITAGIEDGGSSG